MNTTALIPARGGSKRIPLKNIKEFLGKPNLAYSIEAALNCGLFDEVMSSTDDDDIATVALKYYAKVPSNLAVKIQMIFLRQNFLRLLHISECRLGIIGFFKL